MMRFCGIAQIGETQFGFSFGQGDTQLQEVVIVSDKTETVSAAELPPSVADAITNPLSPKLRRPGFPYCADIGRGLLPLLLPC